MVDEEDVPVVVRTLLKTAREKDSKLVRTDDCGLRTEP